MKKLKTNYSLNDAGKLDVEMIHDFYPFKGEDDDIVITCRHLKNGQLSKYMAYIDGDMSYDMTRMFLGQVVSVKGITIETKDGKEKEATKEDLVNIADMDFMRIVTLTGMHLLEQLSLTRDEEKN